MSEPASRPSPAVDSGFLWRICLIAAMGGLLFGYDWVVVGGAKPFYEPFFSIDDSTPFARGLAQSSALIGCLLGAAMSGVLSDRYGRKRLLALSALLFALSAIWTALAWSFTSYNAARILGGVGLGLASNLSPMYIAEVAPARSRGRLVSVNQLTIVIGILLAQVVNWQVAHPVPSAGELRGLLGSEGGAGAAAAGGGGSAPAGEEVARALEIAEPDAIAALRSSAAAAAAEGTDKEARDKRLSAAYISRSWNGRRGWRWMFGAETVPALLFLLLMLLVPESPRWLVKAGRHQAARRVLGRVGGDEHARRELAEIRASLERDAGTRGSFRDLLEPGIPRIVFLGVFLALFQQWCGINVIFNYAQEVFEAAGYGVSDILFNIVITGAVNVVFTLVAMRAVDRVGRRPLLLIGAAGLAGIYALLGAGYFFESRGPHMLLLVVAAIACYSMSLAPVVWVVISEIFPNRIRGRAVSVAVFALWVGCTLLTITFPYLKGWLGAHGAFWLYGAICVAGFLVIRRRLPETRGKSLEAIERELCA